MVNVIVNYKQEYSDKIYGLQDLSDEQLEYVGYTEEQIAAIRNFDGSEEMMALAATTVQVDAGFRNLYRTSSSTQVDLIVAFNSKGLQSNWWNDIFCVTWSTPLTVSSSVGYVEYRDTYYMNSQTIQHTPRSSGLYAKEIEFPKYLSNEKYVYAGSMIINLKSNTYVYDFAALAAYGYTGLTVGSPSVSYPGGVSITFGSGTERAGECYTSM